MVFSIAYHFLRDRWLAEELAQEVFLHLYKNLRAIQSSSHLVYWLRKVTSHRCIDQARRQKLRPRLSLTDTWNGRRSRLRAVRFPIRCLRECCEGWSPGCPSDRE